ncbi:MAG: hypothetical protein QE273_05400 [Verrucomicrobiales bacterium]|nr:hypothetical protein [Verrucomicrobiales bacterium]
MSELLPLIPTAIVAPSGIPMEKEISVPFSADGSLDVKLTALYQICPELFATEITPLNDSVITLPPRVGATILVGTESASFAASSIFFKPEGNSEGGGNAFWSPVTPLKASSATSPAASNPFAAEAGAPKNAFAPPAETTGPDSGKMAGGFQEPAGALVGNAFSAGSVAMVGSHETHPVSGFFGFGVSPTAKNEGETASGGNPFESEKGFATLFSKQAEQDAAIPHPAAPIVEAGNGPEPEGGWGAMFRREVKEEPVEVVPDFDSIGNLLNQAKKPQEPQGFSIPSVDLTTSSATGADGFSAGLTGFSEKVEPVRQGNEGSAKPSEAIGVLVGDEKSTAMAAEAAGRSPASGAGENADPEPVLTEADFAAVEAVFAAAAAPVEAVAETPVMEIAAPAPKVVVEAPVVPPAVATPAVPAGDDDELRDLEMRAIFSTSERFNLPMVARKVVALPGINSCSLSTSFKIVHASRSDETRLGNEAREMIATLRSLAKLTGLPEARTFTLQTDRGIVSLFLEGDCCVSVNQESATFQPGVREKLILIARSIGKLRD